MQQRRAIFDALLRCTKPLRIWDLFAFLSGPSKFSNTNPQVRLLNEYFRLLGERSTYASMSMIEDRSFTLSNNLWRISSANSNYTMCQTYPFALIVPKCIAYDYEIYPCCVIEFSKWVLLWWLNYAANKFTLLLVPVMKKFSRLVPSVQDVACL